MDKVRLERQGGVAVIVLNRPQSANSLDLEMAQDFCGVVDQCADSTVRAVVVTGAGKNFCFGGDLRAMAASGADRQDSLRRLTDSLHSGIAAVVRLRKPVLAAVNGTAAGAGIGLMAMADLAFCSNTSKFKLAYCGVGLTPDAGASFLLPRLIGPRRTLELLYLNRALSGEEALSWGLVNAVYPEERVLEKTLEIAQMLAAGPVEAFATSKRLVGQALAGFETQLAWEGEAVASQSVSAEGSEGIAAFLEKRAAQFGGTESPE